MSKPSSDPAHAEIIALQALAEVIADAALRDRFLALSGIDAADLRTSAGDPALLAGVIAFICAHEPTLVTIATRIGVTPAAISAAGLELGAQEIFPE